MKIKLIILIFLVIVLLALVGALAWYLRGERAVELPEAGNTPADEMVLGPSVEEGGAIATTSPEGEEVPVPPQKVMPRIATTPYTVYLGFAEEVGSSDPALMSAEGPSVVVGYEWEALPGSQMFASVVLPAWDVSGEATYEIHVWDEEEEGYALLGSFGSGEEIDFPREGFLGSRRFKVMGIDPELRICPGDRSFSWVTRFTFDGRMGLVRTPLTENLPSGESCRMR